MMQELVLIRGAPGSGKTTFATTAFPTHQHHEADQYFMVNGEYVYNRNEVGSAHKVCQNDTEYALAWGHSVVVANTFVRHKELRPYLKMAKHYGVELKVYRMCNSFSNVHNVSPEKVERMSLKMTDFPGEYLVYFDGKKYVITDIDGNKKWLQ